MAKNIVPLKNYIKEYSVRNKKDEDIPVYSVTNDLGFCTDYFSKEVASKDKTTYKIVPRGCFAYNPSRINVGSVDWQHVEDRVIVSPLYVVFSVSPLLDQQYLLYYLKSDITLNNIKAYATGSVRDNLKFATLQEYPINLCSLEEQKQIVSELDFVETLITARKEQLEKLDELVKSRFVELFGDTKSNERKWNTLPLHKVLESGSSVSYGIVQTGDDIEGGVPVFHLIDIAGGKIPRREQLKRTANDISNQYSRTLLKGYELLITVRGSVGETFRVTSEFAGCNVGRNIVPLRFDTEIVDYSFMQHFFAQEGTKRVLESMTKGIALQGLNMSEFREIDVIIPAMSLQQQFAAFVEQTDKLKLAIQESLTELETLKKALMQKYFG